MIDAQEHFYSDDPTQGHLDVRTRLKDVSYFFLGNGLIQAAIQFAPSGEGTPLGLLIMNPERFGKKRETLTMDQKSGLEHTRIQLCVQGTIEIATTHALQVDWSEEDEIPTVRAQWRSNNFQVKELFYCPDPMHPILIRELWIKNSSHQETTVLLKTGAVNRHLEQELKLSPDEERQLFIQYQLNKSGEQVNLDFIPGCELGDEAIRYWNKVTRASFGVPLLDHYFNASRFQLPAVVSCNSKMDAAIWQYNREWVRDQSLIALALTLLGHQEQARNMFIRLIRDFVTDQGDTVDSSRLRDPAEVEFDQNGVLLYALENYVWWTGDVELIHDWWNKIEITAEFPLKPIFRHQPSGLLMNQREFWERHRVHGIENGIELAYQFGVSIGLEAAAALARLINKPSCAARWEQEAQRLKNAVLNDPKYRLVDDRGFIKRRKADGTIQEFATALPEAYLPDSVPLAGKGPHWLNPDTSTALPIAYRFIPSDSPIAVLTMNNLERLWDQAWDIGGYGRYHVSSEPDSPGPWPFPSLFLARAYVEMEKYDNVWRILNWLATIPGAKAGSWFEFYGPRPSPPFPQVGIIPWTWAEMVTLLIHHIVGLQPDMNYFRLRPRLLPGLDQIQACLQLRKRKLNLSIHRISQEKSPGFKSNCHIAESSTREAKILYSEDDMWVEAIVP